MFCAVSTKTDELPCGESFDYLVLLLYIKYSVCYMIVVILLIQCCVCWMYIM
jgi:hypothetical protein